MINDFVYGPIRLDATERQLIDLPVIQRLRRIRQLSFMHYVFPGAEHSRFTHCLGTMHLADKVARQLDLSDSERRLVRLAALLHDVGHLPFSHLGEHALELYHHRRKRSVAEDKTLLSYSRTPESEPNGEQRHELIGKKLVTDSDSRYSIRTLLNDDVAGRVAEIMTGRPDSDNPTDYRLSMIVHSAFDVDRLDYLKRDGLALGSLHGSVDTEYFVETLQQVTVEARFGPKETRTMRMLAVPVSRAILVDQFLTARFFHYVQLVKHKTVAAFELLGKAALCYLWEQGLLKDPLTENDRLQLSADEWFDLNDDSVFQLLPRLRDSKDSFWKSIAEALLYRRVPLTIADIRVMHKRSPFPAVARDGSDDNRRITSLPQEFDQGTFEKSLEQVLKEIATNFRLDPRCLGYTIDNIGWESHSAMRDWFATYDSGSTATRAVEDWEAAAFRLAILSDSDGKPQPACVQSRNSLLSAQIGQELLLIRVYYLTPSSEDRDQIRGSLDAIQRAIRDEMKPLLGST